MKRSDKFQSLKKHPYYQTLFKRLKKSDTDFCIEFLDKNESLDTDMWVHTVNRLHIAKLPLKNLSLITDLLLASR